MKRKLIFTLGILLLFSFITVNCNAQSSTNDQRIVGTWVGTSSSGNTITWVFNANGSGTYTTSNGTSESFTYGLSIGGEIKIVYDRYDSSSDGKIYFSFDGRTVIFGFSDYVYRKK